MMHWQVQGLTKESEQSLESSSLGWHNDGTTLFTVVISLTSAGKEFTGEERAKPPPSLLPSPLLARTRGGMARPPFCNYNRRDSPPSLPLKNVKGLPALPPFCDYKG